MLQHGVKLQLVSRTRLVRGERPCCGIEGEVVVFLRSSLAGACRYVEWQNELAFFSGVVQKRWRDHVRRRLLRSFGGRGDTDACRPVGQGDDLLIYDDPLDLLQAVLVKRQNAVANQLLLLELAYHAAVITCGQVALLRNLR